MTVDNEYYVGLQLFSFISDYSGLPIDQVNFIVTQLTALALAPIFRTALHPAKANSATRHAFGLVLGLTFGYICFGMQAIHLAGLPAIAYIIMRTQDPRIMQRIVLAVSLIYLSCIHLHRQFFDYGGYSLDITGPLMVITQKVTTLAFSIHDGLTREESELTETQRYHAVRRMPTVLEYFSYVFHHQALMAGPILFYKDYIEFIDGQHLLTNKPTPSGKIDNNSNSKNIVLEPSPRVVVCKKVIGSFLCAFVYLKLISVFPIVSIKEDEFVENTSLLYKLWYLNMATMLVRFKYYHAWLLADAICNNSGLGFNGYNADGSARWDKLSNIDVFKFELGTSLRDCIAAWNKGTNRWLRMVVYERVDSKHGTILTYALSALWHGFYLGYYLTFAGGALFTISSRVIRRGFRDYFTGNKTIKMIYDISTCLTTRVVMGYVTYPFVILEFWPSIRLYLHMYLCLHILGVLAILVVPRMIPKVHKDSNPSTNYKKGAFKPVTLSETYKTIANGVQNNHNHHD